MYIDRDGGESLVANAVIAYGVCSSWLC